MLAAKASLRHRVEDGQEHGCADGREQDRAKTELADARTARSAVQRAADETADHTDDDVGDAPAAAAIGQAGRDGRGDETNDDPGEQVHLLDAIRLSGRLRGVGVRGALGAALFRLGQAGLQRFAGGFDAGLPALDGALIKPPVQRPGVDECELLCGHVMSMPKGCNNKTRP